MFEENSENQHSDMHQRPVAFAKAVVQIGRNQVIKTFAEFDQPINESFDDLNVSIRFVRPRDNRQFAFIPGYDGSSGTTGTIGGNHWCHSPCFPPVQLVRGSDVVGGVDGLHSFQTCKPPA